MKAPDCSTCGGADCHQGRDCPRRMTLDPVCAGTWAVVLVTGIAVIAAFVDVVARVWQ